MARHAWKIQILQRSRPRSGADQSRRSMRTWAPGATRLRPRRVGQGRAARGPELN